MGGGGGGGGGGTIGGGWNLSESYTCKTVASYSLVYLILDQSGANAPEVMQLNRERRKNICKFHR